MPRMDSLPDIHLGTSAFTAADWDGSFYPEGMKPASDPEMANQILAKEEKYKNWKYQTAETIEGLILSSGGVQLFGIIREFETAAHV
jgi:hypothetical protein